MFPKILQLIREEIDNYFSDWNSNDEPSIADKVYNDKLGMQTNEKSPEINAELIGYVNTIYNDRPLIPAVPVYKNPSNLNGFKNDTRGILLSNGDLYLVQSYNAMHEKILKLLVDKSIVPSNSIHEYDLNYPKNFVAVVRSGKSNTFSQSSAYDYFPNYYVDIFEVGEIKQPYGFKGHPVYN